MRKIKTQLLMLIALLAINYQVTAQCNLNASFTFLADSNGTVVANNTSTGTANSPGVYYFWDFGDGNGTNTQNITYTYTSCDTFSLCLIVGDTITGCIDSSCIIQQFLMDSTCTPETPDYDCESDFSISLDSTGTFAFILTDESLFTDSNYSYTWDLGDGTTFQDTTPLSYTYNQAGEYEICLTIVDTIANCWETYCDSVPVSATNKTIGLKRNITYIKELNEKIINEMKVYPNPISDEFNLEFNLTHPSNMTIYITDILGNQIILLNEGLFSRGIHQLNPTIENMSPGLYLLNILSPSFHKSKKIIVK